MMPVETRRHGASAGQGVGQERLCVRVAVCANTHVILFRLWSENHLTQSVGRNVNFVFLMFLDVALMSLVPLRYVDRPLTV